MSNNRWDYNRGFPQNLQTGEASKYYSAPASQQPAMATQYAGPIRETREQVHQWNGHENPLAYREQVQSPPEQRYQPQDPYAQGTRTSYATVRSNNYSDVQAGPRQPASTLPGPQSSSSAPYQSSYSQGQTRYQQESLNPAGDYRIAPDPLRNPDANKAPRARRRDGM
ncbi:MAG: hypothetical protein M1814_003153 [Vezdaea aestivalis]|nr:MAG: hypothetical protein M1814_003153 [Vezdaea aestivalis]